MSLKHDGLYSMVTTTFKYTVCVLALSSSLLQARPQELSNSGAKLAPLLFCRHNAVYWAKHIEYGLEREYKQFKVYFMDEYIDYDERVVPRFSAGTQEIKEQLKARLDEEAKKDIGILHIVE